MGSAAAGRRLAAGRALPGTVAAGSRPGPFMLALLAGLAPGLGAVAFRRSLGTRS